MSLLGPIIIGGVIGIVAAILKLITDRKSMSQNDEVYYDDDDYDEDDEDDDDEDWDDSEYRSFNPCDTIWEFNTHKTYTVFKGTITKQFK